MVVRLVKPFTALALGELMWLPSFLAQRGDGAAAPPPRP